MAECIDPVARDQILDLHREVSKTQRFVGEVAAVVWGDHERRDNGLRSKVNKHGERLDGVEEDQRELRGELRHYFDAQREETCHGLKALAERDAACKEEEEAEAKEDTAVKVAQIGAGAEKQKAAWSQIATIVVAGLVLAGQVITGQQNSALQIRLAELSVAIQAMNAPSSGGRVAPLPAPGATP